jgi:hypothetical protein
MNPSKRRTKKVKAWAIINKKMKDDGGPWWIDAYTDKRNADAHYAERNPAPEVIVVPCTITYELPDPSSH